ncbi:23S rRNA (cytosine1962-C5)-methyltransferase [Anaeroplasma bactoclasticum]|uniref:23S rRNA (Cytosine1962-C5)-methyltransferase n=1 Tax=Anaeroplasma bactoclasticum TaxID=2088 RepID=A0A397S2D9_9MOLU|nr:23S rRNA (cytosine1962-C5)-methyltransferase [Anaeroplasma bactoclasticum]
MLTVVLNKNEEKEKIEGFPWVFNNEINSFKGDNIVSGEVVRVVTFDGKFVAYGFLNTSSKIMVRILSRNEEDVIDREFFKRKMEYALEHRKNINFNDSNCMRLIFAEADSLPGLIVDKYANYLSVQFLSLGMDKIKGMIVELLIELTGCLGIYERSDVPVREKEGLPLFKGPIYGEFDPRVEVMENGIKFIVDLAEGQKTGYFLDQKLNRDNIKYYCKDKNVLDCFSNVGGFALHACKYGAAHVDACDISKKACDDILVNARLNNFNQLDVICEDTFNLLRDPKMVNKYDTIILDPPAFTKSKDSVKNAYKGYKEINLSAMKIIKSGGYLLTFSCSQHMTPDLFMQMIKEAAHDAKRSVQFLDFRIQSIDHPALLQSDEQLYLKCMILRIN